MSDNTPAWVTEGAKAAMIHNGRPDTLRLTAVRKLTPTQIVLDNGYRFNRRTMRAVGIGPYDSVALLPLDDPQVIQARARNRAVNLGRRIAEELAALPRDADPSTVLAALDNAAQQLAATRTRVAHLAGQPAAGGEQQ